MKTNWQDPLSSEITSPLISGLQEAVGKIEDSIGLQTTAETGIALSEVYINADDRYRIYQAPEGKRNWVASPAPVIKKNGDAISTGFTIDYGGGAIMLDPRALNTDVFTADFTRTNSTHSITPTSIGAETPTGAQDKADAAESAANGYTDLEIADLAGDGRTNQTVKGNADNLASHMAETMYKTTAGTANAQTVAVALDLTKDGNTLFINPAYTNTGAMTINPGAQGAKSVKKFDVDSDAFVALEAGDVKKNTPTILIWSVTNGFFVLAPRGGGKTINSIQKGISSIAGNVTINAVNINKTEVCSKSKGSAGYVAVRGSVTLTPSGGSVANSTTGGNKPTPGSFPTYSGAITGGTTDLTTKEYSAVLVDSTTIYCDGACEWEVIEYT